MEALIHSIAVDAARLLFNPVLLPIPLLGVFTIVTGVAGRFAAAFEDFQQPRRSR